MKTNTEALTLDQLEALADSLQLETTNRRTKLLRMIRAYCRILANREPETFADVHTEYADEDGHFDNSYPPSLRRKNFSGPSLVEIVSYSSEDISQESGFYYSYKTVSTDRGLYFDADGTPYGGEITGTGRIGQFAAHPGDCNVDCEIDWDSHNTTSIPIARLQDAEKKLRDIAFPACAKQAAA